jgi:hypothetical protein
LAAAVRILRHQHTAQVAYLNDVVSYKNIVKMLYIKDDRLYVRDPLTA